MKTTEDKPYLETPVAEKTTTEQMIYGGGETLQEVQEKKKKAKEKGMLNENSCRWNVS